jgi:hypothetical protein
MPYDIEINNIPINLANRINLNNELSLALFLKVEA